jgi:hypothetical protein
MALLIMLLPQALLADDACSAADAGDCAASLLQLKLNERKERVHQSVAAEAAAHREARARAALDATFWWKSSAPKGEEHGEELDATTEGKGGEGNGTLLEEAEGESEGNETLADEEEGESEGEEIEASEAPAAEVAGESGGETEEEDSYLEEMEHAKAEDEAQEKIEEEKELERHEEELKAAEESAETDEVHEEEPAAETESLHEEPEEPAAETESLHEEPKAEVHEEASVFETETVHKEPEAEVVEETEAEHEEAKHESADLETTSEDKEDKEDLMMMAAHEGKVSAGSKGGRSRGEKQASKPIRRARAGEGPQEDLQAKEDGPAIRISGTQ